jgi:hypothetical protein
LALTSFIREAWGSAKEDLLEKAEDLMKSWRMEKATTVFDKEIAETKILK